MIELKRYQPGDELKIDPVENTLRGHPQYTDRWQELVQPEFTWTRWNGDQILGMGGLIPYEDSAYVWVLIDKDAVNSKPLIARGFEELEAMQKLVSFAESFQFDFIWTLVKDGFRLGHRLAIFLGFTKCQAEGSYWRYERRASWPIPSQQA